jgi:hypothetical protein
MCKIRIKYRNPSRTLILLVLLFFFPVAFSQVRSVNEPISKISIQVLIIEKDHIFSSILDTILKSRSSVLSSPLLVKDKNLVFFDSLKIKASKKKMMKRLYDFVIVTPNPNNGKHITGTSDAAYISYTGKKIRNIEIKRLNVFGENINYPASSNPTKLENLLNKTHINTNENIIRKNLLFSAGDTISPLTLSDNERILRQLPFIDDARIIIKPVSENEVDIVVLTKDVYSLGGSYSPNGLKKGTVALFEKNIFGMGHEFGIEMPYDLKAANSPGFGFHYAINNIKKSFIDLNVNYLSGLGDRTYGFNLTRNLVSSTTKYAGGISVRQMYTSIAINNLITLAPLEYNLQDYWFARSFLVNKEKVSRIILGIRYTNNNVFDRPTILPDSYYALQNYRLYLASAAFSIQKYYKTNLIYSYGRTEDIPYGGLFKLTVGKENNEFKNRTFLGAEISVGKSARRLGYFYSSAGISTFLNKNQTEQGLLVLNMKFFSNLIYVGKYRIRNFVNVNYTRGFDRNTDEHLVFFNENGFSGFSNDSVRGTQRFTTSLESVLFSPVNLYGFRFAFFGFADFSFLSGTNQILAHGTSLTGIGLGIRIRNDNMVFNTFQIRIGFFPNPPDYSRIEHLTISGEQLLKPNNFESGPPSIIPYK